MNLLVAVLALISALTAAGETNAPDTVCVGFRKPYWVIPAQGSTYIWKLDGALQIPNTATDTVFIQWDAIGNFTLTVQELTADNCLGDTKSLLIHVKDDPPTVTPPILNAGYCVEDINTAIYQPGGSYEAQTDILPLRPNYYLLPAGNTSLNLTIVQHSCPDTLIINWLISFPNSTNLSGSGQISARTEPIYFQVGTNTITWTVTNRFGHVDTYSVVLVVLPRPEIGDIPH